MNGAVFLESEEVKLKTVEEEDIEWMRDNINDPEIRAYTTGRYPLNLEQERKFFEGHVSEGRDPIHLLITRDGDRKGVISFIDMNRDAGNAEIGLWICADEQGKSFGTEASRLMTDYGFRELRLHRIYARVFAHNPASGKIWEKLGYREEGVMREHDFIDGDYRNLRIYGILREEWTG
ncbi:MAG: GNAT family N-acetyltransferase [Candidatus Thermoplasmatota archaeon]|nr:GNAT family N-acetyltransferase [Candidatus Thermoplasmatota archaeon]